MGPLRRVRRARVHAEVPTELRPFDVLVLDYEMVREDERNMHQIQVAITSVAITLLLGIAAVIGQACQINPDKGCIQTPSGFLAGAPAAPLIVLSLLFTSNLPAAMIRTYYMRALEAELQKAGGVDLHPLHLNTNAAVHGTAVASPSYGQLLTEITSLRSGWGTYRLLSAMMLTATLLSFLGMTIYIALALPLPYRVGMFIGYGAWFTLLVVSTFAFTYRARRSFARNARSAVRDGSGSAGSSVESPGRTLSSYLILPRPEDWMKWLFIPVSFFLASSYPLDAPHVGRAVAVTLIIEWLVYSARYQWNDVRGAADDAAHPEAVLRGRLPWPEHRADKVMTVWASLSVAALRLACGILLAVYLHVGTVIVTAAVLIFCVAASYEWLRSAAVYSPWKVYSLWLLIGLGYGIRVALGVHSAGIAFGSATMAAAAGFGVLLGITLVLMTWALEAPSLYGIDRTGSPSVWNADAARQFVRDAVLPRHDPKWHVHTLLRYVRPPGTYDGDLKHFRALKADGRRDRPAWRAPWNALFILGSTTAFLLGLAFQPHHPPTTQVWTGCLIVLASSVCVVRLIGRQPVVFALFLATFLSLLALNHPVGIAHTIALFAPWAIASLSFLSLSQSSYHELKNFRGEIAQLLGRVGLYGGRLVVGRMTWDFLYATETRGTRTPRTPAHSGSRRTSGAEGDLGSG